MEGWLSWMQTQTIVPDVLLLDITLVVVSRPSNLAVGSQGVAARYLSLDRTQVVLQMVAPC